jgi:hypothetical protein
MFLLEFFSKAKDSNNKYGYALSFGISLIIISVSLYFLLPALNTYGYACLQSSHSNVDQLNETIFPLVDYASVRVSFYINQYLRHSK